MKTRVLILITTIAVAMFGAVTVTAQEKSIYFMKDGNAIFSSTVASVDSIMFIPKPKLSVKPSKLSFSAKATESYDVVVTTNQPSWNVDITSDQTWCTVTKGTDLFTVTATENTDTEQRTATITVTAGYAPEATIAVTQAAWSPFVQARYTTPNLAVIFYPGSAGANYIIEWPAVPGATEYKVYKSTANGDGRTLITTTADLSVSDAEILVTGTTPLYYWVTAVTNDIETPRPANGGIKVIYTVSRSSQTCISFSPITYMCNNWITLGSDNVSRSVTQNPIE